MILGIISSRILIKTEKMVRRVLSKDENAFIDDLENNIEEDSEEDTENGKTRFI